MEHNRGLYVHFSDGTSLRLFLPQQTDNAYCRGHRGRGGHEAPHPHRRGRWGLIVIRVRQREIHQRYPGNRRQGTENTSSAAQRSRTDARPSLRPCGKAGILRLPSLWRLPPCCASPPFSLRSSPPRGSPRPRARRPPEEDRDSKTISIAYRTDATPFSFLDDQKQPIGYTIDLCKRIASLIGEQVKVPGLQINGSR